METNKENKMKSVLLFVLYCTPLFDFELLKVKKKNLSWRHSKLHTVSFYVYRSLPYKTIVIYLSQTARVSFLFISYLFLSLFFGKNKIMINCNDISPNPERRIKNLSYLIVHRRHNISPTHSINLR